MANDVTIVVEASLGDTLVKLDLAKHAVKDLGDASTDSARKQEEAAAETGFFSDALAGMNSALGTSVPLLGGFAVPLGALPIVAGAAAIAVIALADAIGTLVAIVGDLVAPVTLVTGLLGGLGIAFALAAKKALGMHEDGLGQAIHGLKKQFNDLTTTLVGDFMPVFQFLIHNAHDALDFLNRIAKLPLNEAFQRLAQQGVPAVEKFLEKVGSMLARPIRIAFRIAFGTGKGGNEISSAVSNLWNQLSNFLFGYTRSHPIRLDGRVIQITRQHVDGIFQPLIDWFNRHNFTKQGTKIGRQLLNGLRPLMHPIGQFIVNVFEDAVKTAVVGMLQAINPFSEGTKQRVRELNDWITRNIEAGARTQWNHVKTVAAAAWNTIKSVAETTWNTIKSVGGEALTAINNHLGNVKGAISTVRDIASRFWSILQQIAGFFSRVFTLNINWPSPPSWLTSGFGLLGGGGGSSTPSRGGGGATPTGHVAHAMVGGNVAVIHVHGADLSDAAQRRRIAADLGDSLMRRWAQQAGR